MAILNKRISSATLPEVQKDARLGSIIRDVASAPPTQNEMYRTINPSASTNETPSPAYVSQLTSALREMQPQNYTSMVAPTRSNNVSLMSSQMPDMSGVPNISKGPVTSITQPGDTARQKIGSTTSTSGGVPSAVINALAGAVMGLGAQKIINSGTKTTTSNPSSGTQKPPVTSTVSTLPKWAQGNPTITDNKNGTYTQKMDDGSTLVLDKDGNVIKTTDENGDIYIDGEYHHDNGDGTFTITSKDGTVRVVNDLGTVIDLKPAEDKTEPVIDPVKAVEESIIDSPPPVFPEFDMPEGKSGGLAVMMKNGGVPHFSLGGGSKILENKLNPEAPIPDTPPPDTKAIDPVQSIIDLLKTSGGAAGAGGLLAALLSSTGGNTNTVNTGVDMSTYGLLNPRTTNFGMGPARYVPHSDYSQRGSYTPNAELLHNLNAPASNPVNEGDYKDPYITNRPGTTNNQGTDINAIIAQIVNAMKNQQLASQVNKASAVPTGSAVASSSAASTPTSGGFVAGGGGPPTGAEYAKLVATKKAQDAADQAKMDAFHIDPSSRLYQYQKNPSSIPHLYGETDAQAFDRVKQMAFNEAQTDAYRSTLANVSPGGGFVVSNGYIGRDPTANETNTVVQDANGQSRYMTIKERDAQNNAQQQYLMDRGNIIDPNKPFNVASTDAGIQGVQAALANLSQTPGDDKTRQAALQNFLKTTTFTPEQLSAASNGQWAVKDLSSQMANNTNQPDQGGPSGGESRNSAGLGDLLANNLNNAVGGVEPTNGSYKSIKVPPSAVDELMNVDPKPYQYRQHPGPDSEYLPEYRQPIGDPGPPDEIGGGLSSIAQKSEEQPEFIGGYPIDEYNPNDYFYSGGAKQGGAIHKATGGLTHYTYGKPADVMENLGLNHMAQGGLPQMSNVPLVQGRMDFRQGSAVHGEGDGQSDDIPAMLADGEYVIDAETVAQIGNGSTKAGAQALDKFREGIRAHKRSAPINKIPPKTKALTSYLKVK